MPYRLIAIFFSLLLSCALNSNDLRSQDSGDSRFWRFTRPSYAPDETPELRAGVAGRGSVSCAANDVWSPEAGSETLPYRKMRPLPGARAKAPERCRRTELPESWGSGP